MSYTKQQNAALAKDSTKNSDELVEVTHMVLNGEDFKPRTRFKFDLDRASVREVNLKSHSSNHNASIDPRVKLLSSWIKKVGEDSDWDKRAEQTPQNLLKRIEETSARLWELQLDGKAIGFAICAEIIPNARRHFDQHTQQKDTAIDMYEPDLLPDGPAIHYYKFGLDQKNRLKNTGIGAYFASLVTEKLLDNHETVVMNTRRKNAVDSTSFWSKLGFKTFMEERAKNDVEPPSND
ncbi:MAG: hypothetical protein ACRBCK_01005 [Alphaproteobacteria bacterium]